MKDQIEAALMEVIEAVRAYLPPDGISKDELVSRVIYAIDNPVINAALRERGLL